MRYVIKRKNGMANDEFIELESLPGVKILDRAGKWAVLVEADESTMEAHLPTLHNWTVSPEISYDRPEPVAFSATPPKRD